MNLNDYSSRFLMVLLGAFPEFAGRAVAEPEVGCFTIEFPAPFGSAFSISTEDDQITVGFDAHHVHFGGWSDLVDTQDFDKAVDYIRRLMSGDYQVAVWTREGSSPGRLPLLAERRRRHGGTAKD